VFTKACPFFLLVETPLHAGTGADLGSVDLPIQRERHTGFPKVEASGLKGSIREAFEQLPRDSSRWENLCSSFSALRDNRDAYRKVLDLIFGPEEGDLHAGALGFTDARILLFPVRSARGVFAWTTCPAVLNRLRRELELAGVRNLPPVPFEGTIPPNSDVVLKGASSGADAVVLEEYTIKVNENQQTEKLAKWLAEKAIPQDPALGWWREKLERSLVVLGDDDFRDFTTLATEVATRIRIGETGTAAGGALFTDECLPQESLLYSLALASPLFGGEKEREFSERLLGSDKLGQDEAVLRFWRLGMPAVIQVGGDATLGRGLVRVRVWDDSEAAAAEKGGSE
jgi:CRISPR-associated protein Cmr4